MISRNTDLFLIFHNSLLVSVILSAFWKQFPLIILLLPSPTTLQPMKMTDMPIFESIRRKHLSPLSIMRLWIVHILEHIAPFGEKEEDQLD